MTLVSHQVLLHKDAILYLDILFLKSFAVLVTNFSTNQLPEMNVTEKKKTNKLKRATENLCWHCIAIRPLRKSVRTLCLLTVYLIDNHGTFLHKPAFYCITNAFFLFSRLFCWEVMVVNTHSFASQRMI